MDDIIIIIIILGGELKLNDEFSDDFLKDNRIRMDWSLVKWGLSMALHIDAAAFIGWGIMFLLSASLPAVFMKIVSRIVDSIQAGVARGDSIKSIAAVMIALVIIMFVNGMLIKLPELMWYKLEKRYSIGLQRKMCDFMKKVPMKYFDDARTAKVMQMAQSNERTLGMFVIQLFNVLQKIVSFISLIILAWTTSYVLLGVMAVFLAIVIPLGIHNAKDSWNIWVDQSDNENAAQYYQNLVFKDYWVKETRLLSLKDLIEKKWSQYKKPIIEADIINSKRQNLSWSIVNIMISFTRFGLLFAGLFLLKNGYLTLGGLTLFVSVFENIGESSINFGYVIMSFYKQSCELKFKKMLFELDFSGKRPLPEGKLPEPSKAGAGETPIEFECKNVSFSYQKDSKEVLQDVSIKIHKGETVALVGENGAGKSTLIKLLLGLYDPKDGEIFFRGKNYRDLGINELSENIGVVFQDFVNFDLMVRENVAFGDISKVNNDKAVMDAIEKGDAVKVIGKMPKGIDTYLGRWYEKDGVRMSGGEWQRIAASRAYISNRDILIMDEPAAKLDPIAEMEQFNQIKYSLSEKTSILISHRIGFARLADKIIVLQNGRVVEQGTHEELMDKNGIYCDMFSNQASWYQKEA